MSALGWAIVLSLPAYAVLQLLALVALGRRFELDDDAPLPDTWAFYDEGGTAIPGVCRSCGADNDPTYTYCANCVSRLTTT